MSTERENKIKLDKGLCRCCHAEGIFHELDQPRYNLDQKEVYSDMLRHSFDIDIAPLPNTFSKMMYSICDSCILRLRDASNFKKQVQLCEKKFRERYLQLIKDSSGHSSNKMEEDDRDEDSSFSSSSLLRQALSSGVTVVKIKKEPEVVDKVTDIKVEVQLYDGGEDDDGGGFDVGFDDDEDDKPVIQIKREDEKRKAQSQLKIRAKAKKPEKTVVAKPQKPIARPQKPIARPQKTKAAAVIKMKPAPEPEGEAGESQAKRGKGKYEGHYTIVGDEKKFQCNDCDKIFSNRVNYSQHYSQVHLKQRPKYRTCHICGEKMLAHHRTLHFEEKHGVPRPRCNACNRTFYWPHQLIKHQREVHMGEKDYQCDQCPKQFGSTSALRKHMYTHSSQKDFACHICGKAFRRKNHLRGHMLIHLDIRNFVCGACGLSFVQKSSLTYHMTKNHPNE